MNNSEKLTRVSNFIVQEIRKSDLPLNDRIKILKKTSYGKILIRLFFLKSIGGVLFLFGTLIRSHRLSVFNNLVYEDHSSKVISQSFSRAFGSSWMSNTEKIKASRFYILKSLIKNIHVVLQVYSKSDIRTLPEYARCFNLFYFYILWSAVVSAAQHTAICIARTNDPKRLALGLVGDLKGIPVITFTVDQVALRNPAPFAVDTVLCRTRNQKDAAIESGSKAVQMPVSRLMPVKLPIPEAGTGRFGLLLNAKCNPESIQNWINVVSKKAPGIEFLVRPHPGFEVERLSGLSHSVICDWHQPLFEYLDSLDAAFALNTNAIIESLLTGVPVIYVAGLDPYKYDLHRFVADGIVFPYSEEMIFPDSVNDFYKSKDFVAQWNSSQFSTDPSAERKFLTSLVEKE